MTYAFEKAIPGADLLDVLDQVSAALQREGFGIVSKFDVAAKLEDKLGIDFGTYQILGACNPELAYKALTIDPTVGVLLPCNVVVRATEEGVRLAIIDPMKTMKVLSGNELGGVAAVATKKLQRVFESVH
jgi:uncharacterized protein (DUF302 family)